VGNAAMPGDHQQIVVGKMSRNTSMSGKIAPSINAQVMMRARFMGFAGNISSPLQNALPISAPAMPWVMVSMLM